MFWIYTRYRMAVLQHMSEALYCGLWRYLGTNEMVTMRRNVIDLRDEIENETRRDGYRQMFSGSRREGFRMMALDIDVMYWPTDHKLICELSQTTHYEATGNTLILMESELSPPGFVLLRLFSDSRRRDVSSACINMNDKLYISSSLHRELMCYLNGNSSFVPHGPCISGVAGTFEFDQAYCFKSDSWPIQASSWIDRCTKHAGHRRSHVVILLKMDVMLLPSGTNHLPMKTPNGEFHFHKQSISLYIP